MTDIFVSYKREDDIEKGRVKPIIDALRAEGFDVYYDVQVPPGSTWETVLQTQINKARTVMTLWSDASVKSDWVKEEAQMAKAAGKLVPVSLDPVNPPFGFSRIEAADLSRWDGDLSHPEWKGLVAALKARIGEGAAPVQPAIKKVPYQSQSAQAKLASDTPKKSGGMGWLLPVLGILVLGAVGFLGWTMLGQNARIQNMDDDATFDKLMTREIDAKAWRDAEATNTIAAYQRYLDLRPTGAYRADALDRIATLEAEAANAQFGIDGATRAQFHTALKQGMGLGPVKVSDMLYDIQLGAVVPPQQRIDIEYIYTVKPGKTANVLFNPVFTGDSGMCSATSSGPQTLNGSGETKQSFSLVGPGCSGAVITGMRVSVDSGGQTVAHVFPAAFKYR